MLIWLLMRLISSIKLCQASTVVKSNTILIENMRLFVEFLSEKGQREGTIRTNYKLIRKVLQSVDELNSDNFKIFIDKLIVKRASPSYVKQYVSVVRQWGEYKKIPELQQYPYPRLKYKSTFERRVFSNEEIHRFLNLNNPYRHPNSYQLTKNNKGIYFARYEMWIMFFTILFYHGLRTIEIARLEIDMIDFGLDAIVLPEKVTKTGMPREVPIAPDIRNKLYSYVNSLDQPFLFPAFHERSRVKGIMHVGNSDWERFFKIQIERLGIKRTRLTSYSGRHSYGTRQSKRGVPIKTIAKMMGHEKTSSTDIYLHPDLEDLREMQNNDTLRRANLKSKEKFKAIRNEIRKVFMSWDLEPKEEKRMLKDLLNLN
jgi:integrase